MKTTGTKKTKGESKAKQKKAPEIETKDERGKLLGQLSIDRKWELVGMMQVSKTIKCKLHSLTNIKEQILTDEYDDYQAICQNIQECVDNDIEPKWTWFKTPKRHTCYLSGAKIMIESRMASRRIVSFMGKHRRPIESESAPKNGPAMTHPKKKAEII